MNPYSRQSIDLEIYKQTLCWALYVMSFYFILEFFPTHGAMIDVNPLIDAIYALMALCVLLGSIVGYVYSAYKFAFDPLPIEDVYVPYLKN